MKCANGVVEFDSGRAEQANGDCIGLDGAGNATQGWFDGFGMQPLISSERKELAIFMVERWKKYGGLK